MGAVFLIALILYFYRSWHSMERQNTVYSTMDEPSLPVAYVESGDYLMNPMHAYLQDMGKQAARDMITVLPQDRQLKLVVQEYDNMALSRVHGIDDEASSCRSRISSIRIRRIFCTSRSRQVPTH